MFYIPNIIPIILPLLSNRRHKKRKQREEDDDSDSIFASDLYKSYSGECAPMSGGSMNASGYSVPASGQSSDMLEVMWLTNNPQSKPK